MPYQWMQTQDYYGMLRPTTQTDPTMNPQTINLNGVFYPGFLQKRRGPELVYGPDEQACIQSTVGHLLAQATTAKNPGILLGKIQSGKTKTFLGIMALAFDNGYDLAVILTKPTTALAKQTYKRVKKEFADFIEAYQANVYDILEIPDRLTQFEQNQKLTFVEKNRRTILIGWPTHCSHPTRNLPRNAY
jgi:hypothetical protein